MSSGDVFSGCWERGRLTGQGRAVYSSSPILGGGHGRMVPGVGDVYEGGFRDDLKHGYGRCTYLTTSGEHRGERYEGEWVDGLRHGRSGGVHVR